MNKVELSKDRKMRREILRSKMFIKRYYLYLLLSMAIPIVSYVGFIIYEQTEGYRGEYMLVIGAMVSCTYFFPWAIFNLLFMLNVFYAVCKFKGEICFSFARFLFQASVAVISLASICLIFVISLLSFLDVMGLYDAFSEELSLAGALVGMNPFFCIMFFLATTVVFFIYLLLEYIARKKGYVDLAQPVIFRKKISEIIGFFSDYIGMILLFWLLLYYSFILFFEYTEVINSVVKSWFVTYLVFTTVSFFVIRYLCQLIRNTILYFRAKVNAAVLAFMLVIDLAVLALDGGIEIPLIIAIGIIPAFIMLILFFKAKRMARYYLSEEIEVVEEVEHITSEKTGNSAEWKMDEQITPGAEKKSETRMDTDF